MEMIDFFRGRELINNERSDQMIPWWAGVLLLIAGAGLGMLILALLAVGGDDK